MSLKGRTQEKFPRRQSQRDSPTNRRQRKKPPDTSAGVSETRGCTNRQRLRYTCHTRYTKDEVPHAGSPHPHQNGNTLGQIGSLDRAAQELLCARSPANASG